MGVSSGEIPQRRMGGNSCSSPKTCSKNCITLMPLIFVICLFPNIFRPPKSWSSHCGCCGRETVFSSSVLDRCISWTLTFPQEELLLANSATYFVTLGRSSAGNFHSASSKCLQPRTLNSPSRRMGVYKISCQYLPKLALF